MPKKQARLSRGKEAEYVQCLQQMQTEGVEVSIPPEWQQRFCPLDIRAAGSPESLVFESRSGQPYYAILVSLVTRKPLTLVDVEVSVPWEDEIVFGEVGERGGICFHGLEQYPREQVLNRRLCEGLRLRRGGQQVEGWILACGRKPVPADLKTGVTVPCQLRFRDLSGGEWPAWTRLGVQRAAKAMPVQRRHASSGDSGSHILHSPGGRGQLYIRPGAQPGGASAQQPKTTRPAGEWGR
jgi:hypothetical protein